MTSKPRNFLIDLERDGPRTPWGIRLVGGSDLNTPIIITKVYKRTKKFDISLDLIKVCLFVCVTCKIRRKNHCEFNVNCCEKWWKFSECIYSLIEMNRFNMAVQHMVNFCEAILLQRFRNLMRAIFEILMHKFCLNQPEIALELLFIVTVKWWSHQIWKLMHKNRTVHRLYHRIDEISICFNSILMHKLNRQHFYCHKQIFKWWTIVDLLGRVHEFQISAQCQREIISKQDEKTRLQSHLR